MPYGAYSITDHSRFNPSTKGVFNGLDSGFGARLYAKYIQNPPKNGPYGPRLTITARKVGGKLQVPLRIEFSAPKLIYGDSINETAEDDLEAVISRLRELLKEMGVHVFSHKLEEAAVSAVHFAKNIPLSDRYTASFAIRELAKLDVTQKLDINRTQFRNEGHALYFYCGSYNIVFYDKMKDITIPKTKAVDKDKTSQQLELFKQHRSSRQPELLRFEVRLVKKQKLNAVFRELGIGENPTFRDIFRKEISQAVLQHYWKFIGSERYAFLLKPEAETDQLLEDIFQSTKSKKGIVAAKNGFALLGMDMYARKYSVRAMKNKTCAHCSRRTWDRLEPNLKVLNKISKNSQPFGFVKDVETALEEFKPLKVVDFLGEDVK